MMPLCVFFRNILVDNKILHDSFNTYDSFILKETDHYITLTRTPKQSFCELYAESAKQKLIILIQFTETIFLWNVEQSGSLRKALSGHHQAKCKSPNCTNWSKCIGLGYACGCEMMFRHFATIRMKTQLPLAVPTLAPWGTDWKDGAVWTSREAPSKTVRTPPH